MIENVTHAGAWVMATLMIVVASWFFYRFLAPKTWREWASAGLVQAFIIALYAEMYGFPLTIYLLVRFFGLDQTHLSANLWSTLLGVGETGMMIAMLFGYGLLFFGIGLFGEGVVHWPTVFSITVFPAIVIAYFLLARREEEKVLAQYGDEYQHYQNNVPMFFPRMGQWKILLQRSSIAEERSKPR
ncbi:MAG: isoprenylcysteine carboxyl methyltransferase [Gammaproteobacteria bacterium]|nr:isoprenylcysteine carboxyl methyltransferase [Gammaproteobacteria bacterium]